MGMPGGFLKYERRCAKYRPVKERLTDYREVEVYPPEDEVVNQSLRCLDCGIPFCHSTGCSLSILIPEINELVHGGRWREAYERLSSVNPFPEITGRICPALCEASCTLSINDAPVTIRNIEYTVIEKAFENGWVQPRKIKRRAGKKAAVIGSGPAGLAAASKLSGRGFDVTVYEKAPAAGGILRYGIPDFKLEKWVIDRRLDIMKKEGVKFETGIRIGKDVSASYMQKNYDNIIITTGALHPRDIRIPGREYDGIYFAMEYLSSSNEYVCGSSENLEIDASGKNVLVIGGGDTGSDCVGTANRQGAKKVYQYEIMPKPLKWDSSWNPSWPYYPSVLRETSSHREGVEREWNVLTKEFIESRGRVSGARFCRIKWEKKGEGRPEMKEVSGSGFALDVDLVLIAAGFEHTEHEVFLKELGVDYDDKGNIKTRDYSTGVRGVYAAGDCRTGASLVVKAIKQGLKAASKVGGILLYFWFFHQAY